MSLAAALDTACYEGKLLRSSLGELDKSCCQNSSLEVIDFDAYAHSLGGVIPPTTDGVRCDVVKDADLLLLLEMKGLKSTELNFHHQICPEAERGETPAETTSRCQPAFQVFLNQKICSLRLREKLEGTLQLLEGLYQELSQDFSRGALSGRCFLIVNFSYREFLNHEAAFRDALKPLTQAYWGEPRVLLCDTVNNEESFRRFLGA